MGKERDHSPAKSLRQVKGLALPGGLAHPHIHLDKCYLLSQTPVKDG